MARTRAHVTFETARRIAIALPGVEDGTAYGSPAFKVKGKLMSCIPTNKQAEPDSLMVRIDLEQREEWMAAAPEVYYAPPHYQPYPCVLVRLTKISEEALRDALAASHRFCTAKPARKARS